MVSWLGKNRSYDSNPMSGQRSIVSVIRWAPSLRASDPGTGSEKKIQTWTAIAGAGALKGCGHSLFPAQLKGRLKLSDAEQATLGEIGHRLGRKVLGEVATLARPDTILAWYRKLVARKFDGSKARQGPGRPRVKREVEQLSTVPVT
jgi:hypothetical protein